MEPANANLGKSVLLTGLCFLPYLAILEFRVLSHPRFQRFALKTYALKFVLFWGRVKTWKISFEYKERSKI